MPIVNHAAQDEIKAALQAAMPNSDLIVSQEGGKSGPILIYTDAVVLRESDKPGGRAVAFYCCYIPYTGSFEEPDNECQQSNRAAADEFYEMVRRMRGVSAENAARLVVQYFQRKAPQLFRK